MQRFSNETEQVLRDSGWQPGRRVDAQPWLERLASNGILVHESAATFLAEFGGLSVEIDGPGVTRARTPFELDPDLVDGEEDRFADWSKEIGEHIVPIGELDRGRYFLGISGAGTVYIVADWLSSLGTGDEGLERLIRGIAADVVRE